MHNQPQTLPGTIVWVAPFYNRSGYGMQARSFVNALHRAGVRIRILPGNEFEPGVDDCDPDLLRSLENTPVVPPVTAIFSHVPSRVWLDIKLPGPNLRIMATTFDSSAQGNLPPAEWIEVCRKMDQVWLMTEKERDVFISAGFPPEKIQVVLVPHPWMENPAIPGWFYEATLNNDYFRFLSIAMFLPRRRWDTLIEAYLEEFKGSEKVELYLKVNYPSWHPVPGKPRQDLHDLIESLRTKTGSRTRIIVDEDLGTRKGIVELIDGSNVYISTDTAFTGPVGEAFVRHRMAIIPDGLGLDLPDDFYIHIPADPDAKVPLTREMLLYQPHHKGAFMPGLRVKDVRSAMRRAFEMTPDERHAKAAGAASHVFSPSRAIPATIEAIKAGWRCKESRLNETAGKSTKRITWEGSQLVCHSLALINRELCLQLIDSGYEVSIIPGSEPEGINPGTDPRFEKIVQRTRRPLSGRADLHVRHHWPPDFDPPGEGRWVMVQPWEYGRLPESWIAPLTNLVDELWVPSRHVLKTCIASGVPADLVQIVPHGVNVDQFHPEVSGHPIESSKKFRFLFVGGALWRKGVDILLDAYRGAFTGRDDVCLIVKDFPRQTLYKDQGIAKFIRQMRKDPSAPEVIHYTELLDPAQMPGLYTACDCLVHPYRGEGFALPVLEAMACAIPVITTAGGSTDDFCPPECVYSIPSRRIEYVPRDIKLAGGAGWVLEPDVNSLAALLREVYVSREAAQKKARTASEFVRANYNWKKVAERVTARIDSLSQKPVRRKRAAYTKLRSS